MSAEVLRQAAALMRERADRATAGPWSVDDPGVGRTKDIYGPAGALAGQGRDLPLAERVFGRDAKHIASWHPAVAFAVADWLDAAYADWHYSEQSLSAASVRAMSGGANLPDGMALAVARAYLGESPC